MLTYLENNFQELKMPRSLSLRPKLLAESHTQISSLGGGISVDSPKLLESSGADARRLLVKKRRRSPKKRMSLICSERTMKRTSRPKRNSKF